MQSKEYEQNCFGLQPSADKNCRCLILGSMPGVASLRAQQYYAHPRNRFWPLLATICTGNNAVPEDYGERLQMLLTHHIALWDAIGACERQGSLDTAIHNVRGNDFIAFLAKYPSITTICCNGTKSYQSFCCWNKELLTRPALSIHSLPSTSPANASWSFDRLLAKWQAAIAPAIR